MYDLTRTENGWTVPDGLGFDLHVEATSLQEALAKAHNAAEMALSLISFTSQTQSAPLYFVLAYDATPGLNRRELLSEVRVGLPIGSRLIDPEDLQVMLNALDNLQRTSSSRDEALKRLKTIARAIDWLRKGLSEENLLDEFAAYWIGLEAVDPLLKMPVRIFRTCSICGQTISACNHCGAEIPAVERTVNPLEGVRFVMEEKRGMSQQKFNRVRALRGAVLHGAKSLQQEEMSLLKETLPEFRAGLVCAICMSLDVPEATTAKILDRELRRSTIPITHRRKELIEVPELPTLHDIGSQPRVKCTFYKRSFMLENEDMVEVSDTITIGHENCQPVPNSCTELQVQVDLYSAMLKPKITSGEKDAGS